MNSKTFLVLSIVAAGILLVGANGHTSLADPESGPTNPSELSTVPLQLADASYFYFGFGFGGPYHFGYGYHRGHDDRHRPHWRYYDPYRHWYKDRGHPHKRRYDHRPYPPGYRDGPRYYRHPYRR